jgi:hypothetical protein
VLLASSQGRITVVETKLALVEVYDSVKIKFRPTKFARAIEEEGGRRYREALERVAPSAMKMDYPRLPRSEAARVALQSFELVGSEDRRLGRRRSPPVHLRKPVVVTLRPFGCRSLPQSLGPRRAIPNCDRPDGKPAPRNC